MKRILSVFMIIVTLTFNTSVNAQDYIYENGNAEKIINGQSLDVDEDALPLDLNPDVEVKFAPAVLGVGAFAKFLMSFALTTGLIGVTLDVIDKATDKDSFMLGVSDIKNGNIKPSYVLDSTKLNALDSVNDISGLSRTMGISVFEAQAILDEYKDYLSTNALGLPYSTKLNRSGLRNAIVKGINTFDVKVKVPIVSDFELPEPYKSGFASVVKSLEKNVRQNYMISVDYDGGENKKGQMSIAFFEDSKVKEVKYDERYPDFLLSSNSTIYFYNYVVNLDGTLVRDNVGFNFKIAYLSKDGDLFLTNSIYLPKAGPFPNNVVVGDIGNVSTDEERLPYVGFPHVNDLHGVLVGSGTLSPTDVLNGVLSGTLGNSISVPLSSDFVNTGGNVIEGENDVVVPVPPVLGSLGSYTIGLSDIFPFCLPFDLIDFINVLAQEPVTPRFEYDMPLPSGINGGSYKFIIDLSPFNSSAKLLRDMECLAFIVGLILITRDKMIKG